MGGMFYLWHCCIKRSASPIRSTCRPEATQQAFGYSGLLGFARCLRELRLPLWCQARTSVASVQQCRSVTRETYQAIGPEPPLADLDSDGLALRLRRHCWVSSRDLPSCLTVVMLAAWCAACRVLLAALGSESIHRRGRDNAKLSFWHGKDDHR
jgi:hypothetical protein